MRRNWLFLLSCSLVFPLIASAQFGNESPIPYFRYSVTVGVGATQLYGDLDNRQIGGGWQLKGSYYIRHGLSVELELQEGVLRSRDNDSTVVTVTDNTTGQAMTYSRIRRSVNLYHAAILGVNFQPVKFFQNDHLRRIEYREPWGKRVLNSAFVGAGVGAIYSLQWEKRGENTILSAGDDGTATLSDNSEYLKGRTNGFSYIVSTNLGVEFPLHSLKPNLLDSYVWNLVLRGQLNFALDDELDGYSGNYPENVSNDVYGLLSLGVNLRF